MVSQALLLGSAALCFAFAMSGVAAVKLMAAISPKWMQLCSAFAGGVLVAVSLCHMVADNQEDLEPWGNAINRALGGDPNEAFPVGMVLAGLGFFGIIVLEQMVGEHDHSNDDPESDRPESDLESNTSSVSAPGSKQKGESVALQGNSTFAGVSTLVGVTIHSIIEGVAMGASQSDFALGLLTLAVLCHKFFATFAVASSLQGTGGQALWWGVCTLQAATGPLGMLVGAIASADLDGKASAALQCTAGGTLLAIGITHMLIPALEDTGVWKKRKSFAAILAFVAMGSLAIWA